MSIRDKLKAIFKKQKVVINQKSSVNALYTASNHDVSRIADQVNHIQDTLDNLNIPVLPDHSDFAVKSTDNTFSGTNTFTKAVKLETFPEISKGNFEPSLNKQLTPKFYVDKKVNDSATTLNNNITTSSAECLRESKQYTDEKHDQQQTGINHLNTITAKMPNNNLFEGENTFNQLTTMNTLRVNGNTQFNRAVTFAAQLPKCGINPTDSEQLVNKQYVDNRINNISSPAQTVTLWRNRYSTDITKQDITNGTYIYSIRVRDGISTFSNFANKKVLVSIICNSVGAVTRDATVSGSASQIYTAGSTGYVNFDITVYGMVSKTDIQPGTAGNISGRSDHIIKVEIIEATTYVIQNKN